MNTLPLPALPHQRPLVVMRINGEHRLRPGSGPAHCRGRDCRNRRRRRRSHRSRGQLPDLAANRHRRIEMPAGRFALHHRLELRGEALLGPVHRGLVFLHHPLRIGGKLGIVGAQDAA